jgi:N-acyl-D-aspartate/D-glutamate deacylase
MSEWFDIIIAGGTIYDGYNEFPYKADLGIKNGRIVKMGSIEGKNCNEFIKAEGLIVSPGFIDIHTHLDFSLPVHPQADSHLMQGVTTVLVGNCGLSPVPASIETLNELKTYTAFLAEEGFPWGFLSLNEFLEFLEKKGVALNVASLVGHGSIRIAIMGFEDRDPTKKEMEEMKCLVEEAMNDGAFGISTGLPYPPGIFSKIDELIELSKVVAKHGGIYETHLRSEGDGLLEAIEEAIAIGEKANVPVQIGHLKVAGIQNWGKSKEVLDLIERARAKGLDITFDQYPYDAALNTLTSILPPWALEGGIEKAIQRLKIPKVREEIKDYILKGSPEWKENYIKTVGWDRIMITRCKTEKNKKLEGKNILEISKDMNKDPFEVAFDLFIEEEGSVTIITFIMDEKDIINIMKHPAGMIGTDGSFFSSGKPHPRSYGTYPRVLNKYVKHEKILSLAQAIRKMTYMPAKKLGLNNRGVIKEGAWADIVVFDFNTIMDKATYLNPRQYPEGIHYVLVNGKLVVKEGNFLNVFNGKILRHTNTNIKC